MLTSKLETKRPLFLVKKPLYRQARQLLYKVSTKYELWEKIFCTIHDDFFADVTFPFFSSGQIQIGKNHLEQHQ